ncbi:hypothetical protein BV898_20067, partial [Hypsibius exemplaris]
VYGDPESTDAIGTRCSYTTAALALTTVVVLPVVVLQHRRRCCHVRENLPYRAQSISKGTFQLVVFITLTGLTQLAALVSVLYPHPGELEPLSMGISLINPCLIGVSLLVAAAFLLYEFLRIR